jgi:hypothetical protein
MYPYFLQFSEPLLTTKARQSLIALSEIHDNKFQAYRGLQSGELDNNCYIVLNKIAGMKDILDKEIFDLLRSIVLSNYVIVMMHKPRVTVNIHRDDRNYRNTVLSVPLKPTVNYPPTYFYSTNSPTADNLPIATASFINGNPVLLNTQQWHGLTNTSDDYRYNLQVCFNESWETVYDLIQAGKFFR